jgi:hypothetical protein
MLDKFELPFFMILFKYRDIAFVAENTRIFWTSSPALFPLKPRDFCTIIHVRQLRDGTSIILNR